MKLLGLKGDLKMGVSYCLPEADLEMQTEIREVTKADDVIILGDFNYPTLTG